MMRKTAVFKIIHLLMLLLVSMLGLMGVTNLMAQETPPEEPDFFLLRLPDGDTSGADRYQIRFVGQLVSGTDEFLPITRLVAEPMESDAGIQVLNTSTRMLNTVNDPFYMLLLVDTSGSMGKRLKRVRDHLTHVVKDLPENAHISIVGFNGNIRDEQMVAFTNDQDVLLDKISQLEDANGSTCLDDVAYTAVSSIAQLPQNTRRAIILFTDWQDEITVGRPERCSQTYYFSDASNLAAAQQVPIPLYTVTYPYQDFKFREPSVRNDNQINTIPIDRNLFPIGFQRIIDGFQNQFEATIELYTPRGSHTLTLTPHTKDSPLPAQRYTYNAQFDHFPPAKALNITNIVYNEQRPGFDIDIKTCPDANDYCNPATISEYEIIVEDKFTNISQQFIITSPTALQQQHLEITTTLKPERHYLLRVYAHQNVTADNFVRQGAATFIYHPQLVITAGIGTLDRFALQPEATIPITVTRPNIANSGITNSAEMQVFSNTAPLPLPTYLLVDGYLAYTGQDSEGELYSLPLRLLEPAITDTKKVAATEILTGAITVPVAGGWGDYDITLTVTDPRDRFSAQVESKTAPAHWWGHILLTIRRVLAYPWPFVAAILLFLLLLGIFWLAAWVARRMVVPAEAKQEPAVIDPTFDAHLRVDATPDDAIRHHTFALNNGSFVIGSWRECNLTINNDQRIAEQHAEILKLGSQYAIVNCDSNHVTTINHEEIITGTPIPIYNGDQIRLGTNTRMTLHMPEGNLDTN